MPVASTPSHPPDMGSQPRHGATAILVLGMHRSGTSAIARVLNLCGADIGRDLLPPKDDNERGFWENAAVLALHERLLTQLGWQWHDLLMPAGNWRDDAAARMFSAALPAVLNEQFGASRLLAIKDPRLSLLAPLWNDVLAARHVRPVFVITIRHPDEVAASLAKRDGFTFTRSHWLWMQNLIDAERSTRGHARVFVRYERLLADWRGELDRIARQLDIVFPDATPAVSNAIDEFLAPALRHHHGDAGNGEAMPAPLQRLYERACAAADDVMPTDAIFADVLPGYDDWLAMAAPLYNDLSRQIEWERERHSLEIDGARKAFAARDAEVEQARRNIDRLADELDQARSAHALRDRTEEDLRSGIDARDAQLDAARGNIELLNGQLDHSRQVIAAKDRELDDARRNIDALAQEIAQARGAFALKEQEVDAARRNIEQLAADLEQARQAWIAQQEEAARLVDAIASKDHEIDAARNNIGDLAAQVDAARSNIDDLVAQVDAARANIGNLVAQVEGARDAHAARDAADAALRRTRWFRLGRALHLVGNDPR